ncbi:chemotaxis protein CheW [Roseomonas sp. WA12]
MNAAGITAGITAHRLPEGASAIATPVLRPLPGGRGRLYVGLIGGAALPAWVLPGAKQPAGAWALVPGPEGALLLGGDSLIADPPPDAELVELPRLAPVAGGRVRSASSGPVEPTEPVTQLMRGGFRLALVGGAIELPSDALDRLLPMPPLHLFPEPPDGVSGMAWTTAGPVLVIDAAQFGAETGEAPLLAVVLVAGRRIGLPCRGAAPVATTPELPAPLLQPALLSAAPRAVPPPIERAVPTRPLLLAHASAADFALELEDVAAILPPQVPRNRSGGAVAGITAHRGDVLPVLDGGMRLGRAPVLAGGAAVPMLRLQGPRPAALAVTSVLGLRAVPEADIAPVAGDGLVGAMLRLDGTVLPVLRARALLAPLLTPLAVAAAAGNRLPGAAAP